MTLDLRGLRPWEQPELVALSRLPMRVPRVGAPDLDAARANDGRDGSPWFQRLDGTWRFSLAASPDAAPIEFSREAFDDSGWAEVEVPSLFTMHTPATPIYTNIQMPWGDDLLPPRVPDANPTGLYRTHFRLPKDWGARRVVLHFGGFESVLIVWVNGRFAGLAKDSRLASEFDVTDHVRTGGAKNTVAAMVIRWSDASYVEDQDQWWHAGLHREVFLRAPGPVALRNVRARAGLADDLTTGTLTVTAEVDFAHRPEPGFVVQAELFRSDEPVDAPLVGDVPHVLEPYVFTGHTVELTTTVPAVDRWSAESPARYELVTSLVDPHGRVVEVQRDWIGFRRVEIVGDELLVNGKAVLIRGINRHDFDTRTGRIVDERSMRRDLITMKQFGFNAVRTSHAPNDPRFYDLCDEYGLYVVDEANIESHAWIRSLCHDPRYREQWLERGARMVQRDENHPCIIMWSLGNESGYGANHDALAGWIRAHDPTRPLHYEGAIMFDWAGGTNVTDVLNPMYPPIDAIVKFATEPWGPKRPIIMCEYSHAMGNSNGCLADYWAAIESTRGLQGGFIWEWWDHGLEQELGDGRVRWSYGGDWGERLHDANFCCDGVVWPDGTPKPALWEHHWIAAPVRATWATKARDTLRIENHQDFTDCSWLDVRGEIAIDGEVVDTFPIAVADLGPGEHTTIAVPVTKPDLTAGQECTLTVRARTATDLPWAAAGFDVGWRQLEWCAGPKPRRRASKRSGTELVLHDGVLASLCAGDRELVHDGRGPRLSLWRAPTDNDGIKLWTGQDAKPLGRWRTWGLDRLTRELLDVEQPSPDRAVVRCAYLGTDGDSPVLHTTELRAHPDGTVELTETVEVPALLRDLPRVGIELALAPGLEALTWFGRGPHDSYPDRWSGAAIGRWSSTVTGQYVPFVMPQEHGLHVDTRWFELRADDGHGVRIAAGPTFAFSARHHSAADLTAATHAEDLTPRAETIVDIDHRHRGLGTLSCGPDTLERYKIRPALHTWTWSIAPIVPGT